MIEALHGMINHAKISREGERAPPQRPPQRLPRLLRLQLEAEGTELPEQDLDGLLEAEHLTPGRKRAVHVQHHRWGVPQVEAGA